MKIPARFTNNRLYKLAINNKLYTLSIAVLFAGLVTFAVVALLNGKDRPLSLAADHKRSGQQQSSKNNGVVAGDETTTGSGQSGSQSTSGDNNNTIGGSNGSKGASKQSGTPLPTATVQPVTVLVASPSQVVMPANGGYYADLTITAKNGAAIGQPQFSYINGFLPHTTDPIPYSLVGPWTRTVWHVTINRDNFTLSSSGQATVTMTSGGFSGQFVIKWSPTPTFSVNKGSLDRTEDATTITYTANFTLVPNNPYFGNPTITMRLYGSDTNYCINTDLSRTVVYSGQNNYSLRCTVKRQLVYVPGSGYPPAVSGSLNLLLDVSATVGGEYIRGPGVIGYNTPAPYNQ